jgi:negative regulator of flagellin synthesis FlgM
MSAESASGDFRPLEERAVSGKISGLDSKQLSVGASRSVQRPQDAASGGTSSAAGSDGGSDVQITGTARQLATLEQTVRDLPAVDEARVTQIRTAIEQGTYAVQPDQIADRLIQMEQAMHGLPDSAESEHSNSSDAGQ